MAERTLDDLKHDLGLIVASAESDLDDREYPDVREILETLLYRVTAAAESEIPQEYHETLPLHTLPMVGRIDRCYLMITHDARVCGKPQAHR